MALIPRLKKLLREDLKAAPPWISVIIESTNLLVDAVSSLLTKNLSFQDNFNAQLKEFTFQTAATYSDGDFERITFPKTIKGKAIGVILLRIARTGIAYAPITEPVTISWVESNSGIVIDHITGLENSAKYNITLLVV